MKVLVVDDSRVLRMHMRAIMSSFGWQCAEAENGARALEELAKTDEFALALLDVNMPEMNGLECVRRFREEFPLKPVKLMMVTTEAEAPLILQALEYGADEFLMKPFSRDNVAEKLQLLGLAA